MKEENTKDETIKTSQTAAVQDRPSVPRNDRGKRVVITLFALLLIALVGGALLENNTSWKQFWQDHQSVTNRPGIQNDGNLNVTKAETDIASLVAKVSPSVVSITTQSQTRTYFGVAEQEGAGTGIIVSSDGYILTNKHVIDGARTVGVVLTDGTRYDDVKVIGTDPLNDVAFLKIADAKNLTAVELGNSSSARVGQQVVAIGNSLGQYQNTVTSGIISGTGRPVSAQSGNTIESLTDLLQTDAAINPGNSGGPLLNMSGQVIGMNTAIAADAQGIGFAIPINGIKGILKGVLATGEVKRAFLGVNYVPVTPESADLYKLSVKSGAYVYNEQSTAVGKDSPADKAGIKDKDIITKVNDVEVGANGALATLLGEYAPGDTVMLTIVRDNKEQTLKVTLAEYES
jgi:serine protease Do